MLNPRALGVELGRQLAARRKAQTVGDPTLTKAEPVVVNLPAMQINVPEAVAPVVNVAPATVQMQPAVNNIEVKPPNINVKAPAVTVEAAVHNITVDMSGIEKAIVGMSALLKQQGDAARQDAELLRMNLRATIDSNKEIVTALKAPKSLVMQDGKPVGVRVST